MPEVIPAARRVPWEAGVTVGVPGGIPNRTTIVNMIDDYAADNTGAADCRTLLQGAIIDAYNLWSVDGIHRVLYFPAGEYKISEGGVGLYPETLIRGAGPGLTTFKLYGTTGVCFGISYAGSPGASGPVLGSPVKDATSITIGADISTFAGYEGRIARLSLHPDLTGAPQFQIAGYDEIQAQFTRITAINEVTPGETVLTIAPALYFDLPIGRTPNLKSSTGQIDNSGLEDFTVDNATSTSPLGPVNLTRTFGCWVDNVEIKNFANRGLTIVAALQCEIRHCEIHDRTGPILASNGAGILPDAFSACLIEDNIIAHVFPGIEQFGGGSGNVYAYNFIDDISDLDTIGGSFSSNHGPWNSFNLWEGNVGPRYQNDGYFGGSSYETVFRNWFHATDEIGSANGRFAITANRGSYYCSYVANQLGRLDGSTTWLYSNVGEGYSGSSTSSIPIPAYGDDATLVVGAGFIWVENLAGVLVYSNASPSNWFSGRVLDYDGNTLVVRVGSTHGSGTFSDWAVMGSGGYGTPQIYAIGGPNIGQGGPIGGSDVTACAPSLGMYWRCWPNLIPPVRLGGMGYLDSFPVNVTSPFLGTSQVYTTGNVVDYTATGSSALTGGNGCTAWLANNPAKDGTNTWDTPGTSDDWLPWGSNSFQEWDLSVWLTSLFKGNWNAFTNGIHALEAMGGDTYPDSYFRSTKPSFFGDLTWPPVDPTNPTPSQEDYESLAIIPAAWRYIFGNEDYLGGGGGTVATPTFTPSAGTFTVAQSVAINCATSGATIHYTTDGSTPTSGSPIYSTPIAVAATTTIKALAIKSGMTDSGIATAVITIKCATPSFSPAAGTYEDSQSVTITTTTTGAEIRYTTNGTTPTGASALYSSPVVIPDPSTTILKAIAIKSGLDDSTVRSGTYTITDDEGEPDPSDPTDFKIVTAIGGRSAAAAVML